MKRNISFIGISAMMYYFLLPFCMHVYMASMETGNHFIIASMAFFSVIIIGFSSIPLIIGIDGIINSNQMEETKNEK